jgi:hypothetical protein
MRTVAQRQHQPRERGPSDVTRFNPSARAPQQNAGSMLPVRRELAPPAGPRLAHDFGRISLYPPVAGDDYEHQADLISERVMRMPEPQQRTCAGGSGYAESEMKPPRRQQGGVETEPTYSSDVGNLTAPPVVHRVLRSPGQPLEAATRKFMEPRFGHDFRRIRIHTDLEAAKAAAALEAEAFTVGHHIAFARERFRPSTAHGKRLVAHELTHAVQQAATSPHIALQPDRSRPGPKPGRSTVVGGSLGWNDSNEHVLVTREVSGTQGYDDRRQAIAVARLAKAEPAAVVLDRNLKWHAVELNAYFDRDPAKWRAAQMDAAAAEESPFRDVYGLPPLARIEQSRQEIKRLNAKIAELNARRTTSDEDRKTVERDKVQAQADLAKANQSHASAILGVPVDEIERASSFSGRVPGKVNIIGLPDPGSDPGGHGPVGGDSGFELGRQSAFWMTFQRLNTPGAPGTMFHEVTHLRDWELAQEWVGKYQTETGRLFVKSASGLLRDWLNAQVNKGRLTKADAEMVLMEAVDASAYTEARANTRTFLAELQVGAADLATESLVAYAKALKPQSKGGTGKYANPAAKSEVVAALVAEFKTAYKQMSKDMQKQYDAALAAAMKENPAAWISELDFSKVGR